MILLLLMCTDRHIQVLHIQRNIKVIQEICELLISSLKFKSFTFINAWNYEKKLDNPSWVMLEKYSSEANVIKIIKIWSPHNKYTTPRIKNNTSKRPSHFHSLPNFVILFLTQISFKKSSNFVHFLIKSIYNANKG